MKVLEFVKQLHREESGQDLIEYALVLVAVAGAAATGSTTLAGDITTAIGNLQSKLSADGL
jgi:Flp pilus assembly pilin Flp